MDYKDFQKGVDAEHFWFKAKREYMQGLMHRVHLKNQAKILSVGAGTGEDLAILKAYGDLYAIDIDQQALDLIPSNIVTEKRNADVCALPYPDNFFDVVVACDVLEHLEFDARGVAEIYRVLRPGGLFIFTVPACMLLFSGHDRALGHYRRYNKQMLKKLLSAFHEKALGYLFFSLFFPAAVIRLFAKNSSNSTMFRVPKLLNIIFYSVLRTENKLISWGVKFPLGLSLYGIYEKQ